MGRGERPTYQDPLLARIDAPALRWTYEGTMIVLAVAVVALLTRPDEGWVRVTNLVIWGIFVVDYAVRIWLAEDRRAFVRHNIPDLVAILPLDFFRAARVARLARLVRLVRAGRILWRATADLRGVMRTNGLQWVLGVALATVLGGGSVVWLVDPQIATFADGLWWAMVTSTTVGYGDLSPVHPAARGVAVVIMVVGVGTIGMLTGSIATYFTGGDVDEPAGPQVQYVRDRLAHWEQLSPRDRRELAAMLAGLAEDGSATDGAQPGGVDTSTISGPTART